MEFDLSDDQQLLVDTVDRYLLDHAATRLARAFTDRAAAEETTLFVELAAMGLLGILVPEDHGGGGRALFDVALVAELLGYHCAPGPFLEHVVATAAIAWGGSDEQRKRWLPDLAGGQLRATFAPLTASGWLGVGVPASEPVSPHLDWVLHPDGADIAVVPTADGLAVAELTDGIATVEPIEAFDGTRRVGRLAIGDADVEPLGGDGSIERVRDAALVLLAADAIGGARRCVDATATYVNEREQFGVTIAHFQGVKHQFTEMAVEVEPARYLAWYAAYAIDAGAPDAARSAAIAKSHVCDRSVAAARTAVELHGGIGYTWECDLHLYLKRAVFDRAYLGAPSLHRRRAADLAGWRVDGASV